MNFFCRFWMPVLFWITTASCSAQQCPKQAPTGTNLPTGSMRLTGTLQFHDGIRKWFELKLAVPVCERQSIQIVAEGQKQASIESLRGCNVSTECPLDLSGTGYFSLDMYQSIERVQPNGTCVRKRPFVDTSNLRPARWIKRYRVEMMVDYRAGDHPVRFRITNGAHTLAPWQAYTSYTLTGGFVLYGHCGNGFEATQAFETPQAKPTLIEMATFDPEAAASVGVKNLRLGSVCER